MTADTCVREQLACTKHKRRSTQEAHGLGPSAIQDTRALAVVHGTRPDMLGDTLDCLIHI